MESLYLQDETRNLERVISNAVRPQERLERRRFRVKCINHLPRLLKFELHGVSIKPFELRVFCVCVEFEFCLGAVRCGAYPFIRSKRT